MSQACTSVRFHRGTLSRHVPLAQVQCVEVKDAWARIGRCPYRYRHPQKSKARARPTRDPTPFRSGSPAILILISLPARDSLILSCKQPSNGSSTQGRTRHDENTTTPRGPTARPRARATPGRDHVIRRCGDESSEPRNDDTNSRGHAGLCTRRFLAPPHLPFSFGLENPKFIFLEQTKIIFLSVKVQMSIDERTKINFPFSENSTIFIL